MTKNHGSSFYILYFFSNKDFYRFNFISKDSPNQQLYNDGTGLEFGLVLACRLAIWLYAPLVVQMG